MNQRALHGIVHHAWRLAGRGYVKIAMDDLAQSNLAGDDARFLRAFATLGKDDTSLVGGKGANLGELSRAGLPVPPGFVTLPAPASTSAD